MNPLPSAPVVNATTRDRTTHMRLTVACSLVLFLLSSLILGACETTNTDRAHVIWLVNNTRAENGLGAVQENVTLNLKADAWAAKMRDACTISHSSLKDGAPEEWQKLGENVGRGGTVSQVHSAYLKSPGHLANIVDPTFNSMGAGAVWGNCNGQRTLFTAQVFMKS